MPQLDKVHHHHYPGRPLSNARRISMTTTEEYAAHLATAQLGVDKATLRRWECDGLTNTRGTSAGDGALARSPFRAVLGVGASSAGFGARVVLRSGQLVAVASVRRLRTA